MSDLHSAIQGRSGDMMAAFARQDVASLQELYADEGTLMLPHVPKLTGRAAIGECFSGMFQQGIRKLKLNTETVLDFGAQVLECGSYSLHVDGDVKVDAGNYQVLWTKQNGTWTILRDIATSSEPMAAS